MNAIKETLHALPEYSIVMATRPDASILLTIEFEEQVVTRRVIDKDNVNSLRHLEMILYEIKREIVLSKGEVTWKGKGSKWLDGNLPTYTGCPVQRTAAKTLFERRRVGR
ncbi:DUF3509 domain-containing protein [Pseudomonas sp. EL_65y_Pfl2_R95]|uniref:DUF3509 domain-containing protein n=1 Tax=Pseudomonas sp. EL_65y_Pfl2_R95 TaxID=3088698 RepID=UPI0030DC40C6